MQLLSRGPVLVVGDCVLDVTHAGKVERISPEAPLPVLAASDPPRSALGGAGAVAAILRGLGAQVGLLSGLGSDPAAERCRRLAREAGIAARWATLPWPTPVKHRFTVDGRPLGLRWDQEQPPALRPAREGLPCLPAVVERALGQARAVVIADYGKGFLCAGLLRELLDQATRRGVPVLVDPARGRRWLEYQGAAIIKANAAEYAAAGGIEALPSETRVVVTRGPRGISWRVVEGDPPQAIWAELPADPHAIAAAVDPTGCGDTVAAVLGLALAAAGGGGLDWPAVLHLANVAGGLQAAQRGVVPLDRRDLLAAARVAGLPADKRLGPLDLPGLARTLRATGRRATLVSGCFAALHAGHVALLQAARQADPAAVLVAACNSSESIRRLKGPRPTIADDLRLRLLAALPQVDGVVLLDGPDPRPLIEGLRPALFCKGPTSELRAEEVAAVEAAGGRAVQLDGCLVPDCSTANLAAAD